MKNIFSKVKKTIIKEYPNVKNDKYIFIGRVSTGTLFIGTVTTVSLFICWSNINKLNDRLNQQRIAIDYQYSLYEELKSKFYTKDEIDKKFRYRYHDTSIIYLPPIKYSIGKTLCENDYKSIR